MRVSVSAYIKDHGTHLFCYNDPSAAHADVQSAIKVLKRDFGNPVMSSHGTKNRQRICWEFKGGHRVVKTIQ